MFNTSKAETKKTRSSLLKTFFFNSDPTLYKKLASFNTFTNVHKDTCFIANSVGNNMAFL